MIVVGDNLKQLMQQYQMVDREKCFDTTCITLSLGESIVKLVPRDTDDILTYGQDIPEACVKKEKMPEGGLLIPPKSAILGCSLETIFMPVGYMGLLQTKGSLARLFVSLHFSDGQIDPGYRGSVTFEIFNASDFQIRLCKGQPVGNLYVIKTTTRRVPSYHGKYAGSSEPTIQKA